MKKIHLSERITQKGKRPTFLCGVRWVKQRAKKPRQKSNCQKCATEWVSRWGNWS